MANAESKENNAKIEQVLGGEHAGKVKPEDKAGAKPTMEELMKTPPPTLFKGKLKLVKPLLSADKTVDELEYDFDQVTGTQMVRALDADRGADPYKMSNQQALCLFAFAAKGSGGLDEKDIVERLGMRDIVPACHIAKVFFNFTVLVGNVNIKG